MINFDIWGMINPQCSVTLNFEARWMIRLISPVAILVPVSGGIYWYSLKPGREDMSNRAVSVTVQVLHMMFVGTTLHSLDPMRCTDYVPAARGANGEALDTIRVIDRFPKVPCDYSDSTYFRMFVASAIGFTIYTIAYVLFILYTLYRVNFLVWKHRDYVAPPPPVKDKKTGEAAYDGDVSTENQIILDLGNDVEEPAKQPEALKTEENVTYNPNPKSMPAKSKWTIVKTRMFSASTWRAAKTKDKTSGLKVEEIEPVTDIGSGDNSEPKALQAIASMEKKQAETQEQILAKAVASFAGQAERKEEGFR